MRMPPISRRDLLMSAAAVPVAGAAAAAQPAVTRPNIVFIIADDMGYADVSCYGRPDMATPNVDRIAAQGTRFTQGYSNSPVCSASRVAIMTGRYQLRLPVGLEEPISGTTRKGIGLPPEHPTLPSLLKKAGYGTTLVGKWHLGSLPDFGPHQSGYDHFYGFRGGAIDYFLHTGRNGSKDFWEEDERIEPEGYATTLLGDRAVRVVEGYARTRQPFLLSLHFNAPHWPWEGPDDRAEAERLRGKDPASWDAGSQETYRRMIAEMDRQIGRVMEALEKNGLARDTIIIFTSDNGGERFADTWPFSGHKTELLEGGLRVPAIISWPARIPAGRVSEQVTANMDWMPTLLAAAGAAPDPRYPPDGMNLLPHLAEGAPAVERQLFWRYKSLWQRAARIGDWKYLKMLDNTFLFNVVADPLERANMKEREPEVYRRLVAAWDAWNGTMLPEVAHSFTEDIDGSQMASQFGTRPSSGVPDPTLPGSEPPAGQAVSPFLEPKGAGKP
ncbi:sulfatase-like hydrolase/transferase [Roseomonas gilardii subsp. gilardii]|uniref:sulfatase family protein n=1 Tax=Roseomonas gilardii TaxID=257708 RepID=UPI001FF868F3|nr:sulfatase-like hydrolase/transferase [Roseomonas gilardii]UPG73761.1 sulfatase-like hydrolase/transferase [Roseomonas gilardii subsp. gilardii]